MIKNASNDAMTPVSLMPLTRYTSTRLRSLRNAFRKSFCEWGRSGFINVYMRPAVRVLRRVDVGSHRFGGEGTCLVMLAMGLRHSIFVQAYKNHSLDCEDALADNLVTDIAFEGYRSTAIRYWGQRQVQSHHLCARS